MEFVDVGLQLDYTGERLITGVEGDTVHEHLHRYSLAWELARDKAVVDVACGEGYGSNLLALQARQVLGVDMSPETVAHARKKYRRGNLHFQAGDCARIPAESNSVDLVVSFETIEHHDRHRDMLLEIKRILRPDGTLLISTPEKGAYTDDPHYRNPFHVRELYLDEFVSLLKDHFRNVVLLGQRVCHGSVIAPLEDVQALGFKTYRGDFYQLADCDGLKPYVYVIAVASDALIASFPAASLFEGKNLATNMEQQANHLRAVVHAKDREIAFLHQHIAHMNRAMTVKGTLKRALGKTWRLTAPLRPTRGWLNGLFVKR